MSKAELILPGQHSPEDESVLIDRFTMASRELVPSVQITLAKRIIKPGTNRVVCLAARTSIPLNDDEVASVSDLALRLSDGTNVALSLSFFNENCATEYATFTHNVYDPQRYPEHSGNKLGMVVVATALAAAAAFFSMVSGPLNTITNLKAGLAAVSTPIAPLLKSAMILPATKPGAPPSKPTVTAKPAPKQVVKRARVSRPKQTRQARTRTAATGATTRRRAPVSHNSMLVPPPPPFPFTLPNGRLMTPYDPMPKAWTLQNMPMSEPFYTPAPSKKAAGQSKAAASKPAVLHEPPAQMKPAAQPKSAHLAESQTPARPATQAKAVAASEQPAQSKPATAAKTALPVEPPAQAKPATTQPSKPAVQSNAQTTRTQPVREPEVSAPAPTTKPVVEKEAAKATTASHHSVWERPAQQQASSQQSRTPIWDRYVQQHAQTPQHQSAPAGNGSQMRAPVPGDDSGAAAGAAPERFTAPPHGAPTSKFNPIPWPD